MSVDLQSVGSAAGLPLDKFVRTRPAKGVTEMTLPTFKQYPKHQSERFRKHHISGFFFEKSNSSSSIAGTFGLLKSCCPPPCLSLDNLRVSWDRGSIRQKKKRLHLWQPHNLKHPDCRGISCSLWLVYSKPSKPETVCTSVCFVHCGW